MRSTLWLRTLAGLALAALLATPAWAKDDKKEGDDEGASAAQALQELTEQLDKIAKQADSLMEKMGKLRSLVESQRLTLSTTAAGTVPGGATGAVPTAGGTPDAEMMRKMMEHYAKIAQGGGGLLTSDPELMALVTREAELQGALQKMAQSLKTVKSDELEARVKKEMKKVAGQLAEINEERRARQLEQLKTQLAELEAEAEDPPTAESILENALREKTEGTPKPEQPADDEDEAEDDGDEDDDEDAAEEADEEGDEDEQDDDESEDDDADR